MSKLEHGLARRYRNINESDDGEEELLIRPDEARKCDTLTDPYTGEPLFLRAEKSTFVRPHFAIKEKLTENDKKIKEKLSSETDDDRIHKLAQDFIKKAYNENFNIKIYRKRCGKHYSKEPICFRDLLNKGCSIKLECPVLDTHKRWDILISDYETGEIMLGIEVYNTHKTHETSRPPNVPWVEIDVKDINDELRSAISESNFDTDSKIFEFYCMRSFIDNLEISKCDECVKEEEIIKNQKEQENREKEVQERMRQYRIRQDLEREETRKSERKEREEKERQEKERERIKIEEKEREKRQWEERQEREKRQWEEDEEKRKIILEQERKKLKIKEENLVNIEKKLLTHTKAINNLWKEIKIYKNNELKIAELKKHEEILVNFKNRNIIKKTELNKEIVECKNIIEKNKLPKQKPNHYTFN